jgi:hypothetical protein
MALLCDYFMAASDETAADVIDWVGGPARPPEEKRGFLRRTKSNAIPYEVVALPGVEPTVTMGRLEELLTGRSIDEIIRDPAREPVASRDGGERIVIPLGMKFEEALVNANSEQIQENAQRWSQAEEFWGEGDAGFLTDGLRQLAALVRAGREQGQHLYCWVSV